MAHTLPASLEDIDYAYAGARLFLATAPEDVIACRDLSFHRVAQPDYACIDLPAYRAAFNDTSEHVYLAARALADDQLIGTYRLQPNYDLKAHPNLEQPSDLGLDELHAQPGRVADVASFIANSPLDANGAPRAASTGLFAVAWITLFRLTIRYCHVTGIDALYIQARPDRARTYVQVGFIPAGPEFTARGWRGSWIPMLLRLDHLRERYADPSFAKAHRERTGIRFRPNMWTYFLTDDLPPEHLLMID